MQSNIAACGESPALKGHDFSRAVNASESAGALALAGCISRTPDFCHRLIEKQNITRKNMRLRAGVRNSLVALAIVCANAALMGQMGTPTPLPAAERQKAEAERKATGPLPDYPQLVDITAITGINFDHLSSPEAKFIAESMSGGVALIDYDRRWLARHLFHQCAKRGYGAARHQGAGRFIP